jgi:hypothetical protein
MDLEDAVRRSLAKQAESTRLREDGWAAVQDATANPRRLASRTATILLATTLSVLSLGLLWFTFRPSSQPSRHSVAPAVSQSFASPAVVDARVVASVQVAPFPGPIAVGPSAVWVGIPAQSAQENSAVAEIDPLTDQVVRTIDIDGAPDAIAASGASVWVATEANEGQVIGIDVVSGQVTATVPGAGGFLAANPTWVWALSGPDTVVRIDASTGQVAASIPLGLAEGHFLTGGLVLSADAVWTLDTSPTGSGASDAIRIDAADDSVSFVNTDAGAGVLAADGQSVWLSGGKEAIEIGAASGEIVQRIELPEGFNPFAVASGRVWFVSQMTGGQYEVEGLNPETGEIDSSVTIESFSPAALHPVSGASSLSSDALWVSEYRRDVTHIGLS